MNNFLPHYELLKVRGEESVRNFKMAPNSETILVDETAPLVWYVQTDSSGYLSAVPYLITLYKPEEAPQVDINELAARVKQLEENYVQQSDASKSAKPQQHSQPQPNSTANGKSK